MIKKIVNAEAKTTKGTLSNVREDFIKFITKKVSHNSKYFNIKNHEDFAMKDEFTAIVKCAEDDVYDEEIGKIYVKFKVLDKYYNAFDRRIKDVTIDCFRLGFTLLDWIYNHISIGDAEDVIVEVATKFGYIITPEDEISFEFENSEDEESSDNDEVVEVSSKE